MTVISAEIRDAVARRAGDRCEYCLLHQESQVATFPVDHIIPVVLNGLTELGNLALACPRCNTGKWIHVEAHDPLTGLTVPLFNPRSQTWNEHFRWSTQDPTLIEPVTPCGRATVALLDLNSEQHRLIRKWLMVIDRHPPQSS